MTIRDRVKLLCKEKKISLNQLEIDCGFAKGYLSKLDKSTPNIKNIQKIADRLNVTVEFLATGEEEKEQENESVKDKDLIVLYRKLEKVPDEERQMMIEQFNSSIDVFLKRKGLIE